MTEKISVILAAGSSTRMNTNLPKVLHEVCGRPMLEYVLEACRCAGVKKQYVVVGFGAEIVKKRFKKDKDIVWVLQAERKGTGHAVLCCQKHIDKFDGDTLILCGDGPLIRGETLKVLVEKHQAEKSAATLATALLDDPSGYGRIVRDDSGNIQGIVEHSDCTKEQLAIKEINPSYYLFDNQKLLSSLAKVTPDNAKKEYYLTDALKIMIKSGQKVTAIAAVRPEEAMSINSRIQLSETSKALQKRIQNDLIDKGVTIVDPLNTWIDSRVEIGQDTIIEPFTCIHGKVKIGKNCRIGPLVSLVDGSVVKDGIEIKPKSTMWQKKKIK